jgi:DNA-binding response OmpR family regulator
VRMGRFTLDLAKRELHDDEGNDVAVTAGEFDILKIFAENPNRPLSRDWLLETTSHRSRDPFDRAIDLRITRIRRKIEPSPEKPTVIRTVRGIGYMFVPPVE